MKKRIKVFYSSVVEEDVEVETEEEVEEEVEYIIDDICRSIYSEIDRVDVEDLD